MDLVTGTMGSLTPKLLQLLQDEYKLQKGVKTQVDSLTRELENMHAALCKVAQVPHDQLDPQVKLWARDVREASYDIEDIIDAFLVRVAGGNQAADADKAAVNCLLVKIGHLFSLISKIKARREIASTIKDIEKRVKEVSMLHNRYNVGDHIANCPAIETSQTRQLNGNIDPRLLTLLKNTSELVGIDKPRDDLVEKLSGSYDDASNKKMKVVSIFGLGGLGKTTLAKVVYDKLIAIDKNIDCKAFVPVGQNPVLRKVFRDILLALNKERYMNTQNFSILDERQLIEEIQDYLKQKRYIIVIDDVWKVSLWKTIRTVLVDNNLGCKVIITTRSRDVANDDQIHYPYQLMPLLSENSKILFYGRIFGSEDKCPAMFSELSKIFLKKCGGVPLAIITLSSLLAVKLDDITDWEVLCNAIGSGISSNDHGVRDMRKILSLSYYDLPSYLKTCFLYLNMYPEDYEIKRDQLIWKWITEGFIQPQPDRDDLFEVGKTYFNELINRSLVQPVGSMDSIKGIYGCRVHDMVLDLICSLSREENFVTTSHGSEQVISSGTKIHRLSLNNSTCPDAGMPQVRSIIIFQRSSMPPSFSSFGVLRVLALEGYGYGLGNFDLSVGNLIHLRYLGLKGTWYPKLPNGIEKLQYLQVFTMERNAFPIGMSIKPVLLLKQLMCLNGFHFSPRPGNLLRNLASLQMLDSLYLNEHSVGAVKELGHLTKLTILRIEINMQMDQSIVDALISSLGKLQRLQKLTIVGDFNYRKTSHLSWENWRPSPHLRMLIVNTFIRLRTLPKWISSTSLPDLTDLRLQKVKIVRPEDIQILGELRSLLCLWLEASKSNLEGPLQKFVLSATAFPRVTSCGFFNVVTVPSMFPRGAMPRVEELNFCLRARDFFSSDGFNFSDLAMEQFPSLKVADFAIQSSTEGIEEVNNKVKKALKRAGYVHPNHPVIGFL